MASSSGNSAQIQELLDKVSTGDAAIYDEIVTLASDRLLKLTRKMLRHYPRLRRWEQTDDVFQNAVLRLHRSLSTVQPENVRAFFGLATTQIRRTLIDLARHHFGPEGQGAKHDSNVGPENEKTIHYQQENSDSPEDWEAWARFHHAADSLPEEDREVFQLLWYAGMDQKQVANLIGLSVPTVQRRWYRARHNIIKALSDQQSPFSQ